VIDAADAADAGQFNWFTGTPYAMRTRSRTERRDGGPVTEFLHVRVARRAGISTSGEIDHRNGIHLDCRRSNLRAATPVQNRQNIGLSKKNTSGVKGVSWDGRRGLWWAEVKAYGRRHRLGRFAVLEQAKAAVMEARTRLHGEFANHGTTENL
jgi:hypothetical protein